MVLLKTIFENAEALEKRFGLSRTNACPSMIPIEGPEHGENAFIRSIQRMRRKVSERLALDHGLRTCYWVVTDRRRFHELVNYIDGLISELEILTSSALQGIRRQSLVQREVNELSPDELEIVSEAKSSETYDPLSDAASNRLEIMSSRDGTPAGQSTYNTASSSRSTYRTPSEGRYRYQELRSRVTPKSEVSSTKVTLWELCREIRRGHLESAKLLFQQDPDIVSRDHHGLKALEAMFSTQEDTAFANILSDYRSMLSNPALFALLQLPRDEVTERNWVELGTGQLKEDGFKMQTSDLVHGSADPDNFLTAMQSSRLDLIHLILEKRSDIVTNSSKSFLTLTSRQPQIDIEMMRDFLEHTSVIANSVEKYTVQLEPPEEVRIARESSLRRKRQLNKPLPPLPHEIKAMRSKQPKTVQMSESPNLSTAMIHKGMEFVKISFK